MLINSTCHGNRNIYRERRDGITIYTVKKIEPSISNLRCCLVITKKLPIVLVLFGSGWVVRGFGVVGRYLWLGFLGRIGGWSLCGVGMWCWDFWCKVVGVLGGILVMVS